MINSRPISFTHLKLLSGLGVSSQTASTGKSFHETGTAFLSAEEVIRAHFPDTQEEVFSYSWYALLVRDHTLAAQCQLRSK